MAKAKAMVISGPMNAKHVGGVNVMSGTQQSGIDSYFTNTTIEPDETPSHSFVATGKIEVPRRSDTIASTIRRPSLSIKRSFSKLRRSSISHISDVNDKVESEHQTKISVGKTESTKSHKSLKMQSSISRLRQRVGLQKNMHINDSSSRTVNPEPQDVPKPLQKDDPPLRVKRSTSRFALRTTTSTPEPKDTMNPHSIQRQASYMQRQPSVLQPRPSPIAKDSSNVQRHPSPVEIKPSSRQKTVAPGAQPPTRPKRVDSGTAIDLDYLPVNKRPLGFQAILAVQNFEERMKHYARARHYWAHAEHGLDEWTQAVTAPRVLANRA